MARVRYLHSKYFYILCGYVVLTKNRNFLVVNLIIQRQHCYNCGSSWMSRMQDRKIGNWEKVKILIFGRRGKICSEMDKGKLDIPIFKFKVRRPTGERRKDRIQKTPSCGIWLKNCQILITKQNSFFFKSFSYCQQMVKLLHSYIFSM